ncbi:MAG TPA: molybdopterin-guanine dinucleotide biosynthesis protein B, partial [Thermoanaerobaculia bacterium]|nr:molybdopterin-guanine dinucleotide biosynthesis protein B [Thermoanaerobaculia bacterium]
PFRDLSPPWFAWRTEIYECRDDVPAVDLLGGTGRFRQLVDRGESLDGWIDTFAGDLARFAPVRARNLLYPGRTTPPALLVVGAHESGKTTVAVRLIEALAKEGLRVGSLKHTDHEYETDAPGKDSSRHKAAGAEPAILVAGSRSAVHRKAGGRPALSDFLPELAGCDLVIVEGFRGEPLPKIEVCRAATGRAALCEDDPSVLAVVTDRSTKHASSVPRFSFEEIPGLLLFLRGALGLPS